MGRRLLRCLRLVVRLRYDVLAWQSVHTGLSAEGRDFAVIAVAFDEDPDDVRPGARGLDDRWKEAGQPLHGLSPKFSPPST